DPSVAGGRRAQLFAKDAERRAGRRELGRDMVVPVDDPDIVGRSDIDPMREFRELPGPPAAEILAIRRPDRHRHVRLARDDVDLAGRIHGRIRGHPPRPVPRKPRPVREALIPMKSAAEGLAHVWRLCNPKTVSRRIVRCTASTMTQVAATRTVEMEASV